MKYLTGTHALNLVCPLKTDGDWHYSSIDWPNVAFADTKDSVFGRFGIYQSTVLPYGQVFVANHIRAVLDLLEKGHFGSAQGMREDYINNEAYTPVIFDAVYKLCPSPLWPQIDAFMGKEYLSDWLDFKESQNVNTRT